MLFLVFCKNSHMVFKKTFKKWFVLYNIREKKRNKITHNKKLKWHGGPCHSRGLNNNNSILTWECVGKYKTVS